MSAPWILHRLYSLDTSSSDSLRRLYCLIRHGKEEHYLSSLQGLELARLVDFLDQVRTHRHPSAFCQLRDGLCRPSVPFPPTAIFLENVSTSYKPSAVIARYCRRHTSYLVKPQEWAVIQSPLVPSPMYGKVLVTVRKSPSSVGGFSRAIIRPLRRSMFETARLYHVHPGTPVGTAAILQRGHNVEKVKAPEHCPFHRRHNGSSANRLGVDAERKPDRVRREKSGHESDRPGRSFSVISLDR